jgi:DNA-binding response OmpR family regulator
MVVEDEAIIAIGLEDGLADHGFEVAGPFSTCGDALAFLRTDMPELAILDAMLSDGSCVVLARELQERGVPFLIYSGADADKELADEFGNVRWIEKPCDIRTVVNAAVSLRGKR